MHGQPHIKIITVATSWLFPLLYQWCTVNHTSKLLLLQPVGCFHYCINNARSNKPQKHILAFVSWGKSREIALGVDEERWVYSSFWVYGAECTVHSVHLAASLQAATLAFRFPPSRHWSAQAPAQAQQIPSRSLSTVYSPPLTSQWVLCAVGRARLH